MDQGFFCDPCSLRGRGRANEEAEEAENEDADMSARSLQSEDVS